MLNWVRDQAEKEADLQQYVPHLQSNTILRLLQQVIPFFPPVEISVVTYTLWHKNSVCSSAQVAQIYQSIEFTRLASLVPFVDAFQLERSIVDAARHCDLQVSSATGSGQLINKLIVMFWMLNPILNELFSDLGPYRSHHSHSELWVWFELLYQRGFPSWPFSTENALRANQEPADCHVCIVGQSYPGHQACLHPGELTCLSLWTVLLPNFLINDV